MRLVNTRTLELHDFYLSEIPQYAILSHTWGDDEVTFQDMSLPNRSLKKGYVKITQTCHLALEHGLGFVWVDTCCIDKTSSAELTESINSMFQWYMNAAICYVSLEDLSPDTPAEDGLGRCRWFTRGWTLQELLAPKKVGFYDMIWNFRGSKLDFIDTISNITGIPGKVLQGHQALTACSVASRMSWAAHRQTTRTEDMSYCLLGIFDVNMTLIYGEGLKAFRRLQEEIVKRNNDLTIFAWDISQSQELSLGLFAKTPAAFVNSLDIVPFANDFIDFSVTNKGLLVSGDIPLRTVTITGESGCKIGQYLLFLGANSHSSAGGGIYLRKLGPRLFYRDGRFPLAGFGVNEVKQIGMIDAPDYYIIIDPIAANDFLSLRFRSLTVHVPVDDVFRLVDKVPETLWDITDRLFLKPRPDGYSRYAMVIAMAFDGMLAGSAAQLVVLCDYRSQVPICKVFRQSQYPHLAAMIFQGGYRNESILWTDLEIQAPDILLLSNCVEERVGNQTLSISVSFDKKSVSRDMEFFCPNFNIARLPDKSKGKEQIEDRSSNSGTS